MFWDEKAQTVYEFAYCPDDGCSFFGLEANILLLLFKFYGHQTN